MLNALSFDIEDWFHICGSTAVKSPSKWHEYESRVLMNTQKILDILRKYRVSATFFVLGWIAEYHPEVVHAILESNPKHEIATHGYIHNLIYKQTPNQFKKELLKSITILESIIDNKHSILGHRAPSFSIKEDTKWAFDVMVDCGIKYDSSIFSGVRSEGGVTSGELNKSRIFRIRTKSRAEIIEFPFPMTKLFGKNIPTGGGYFRLFPYYITHRAIKSLNTKGQPALFYLHPRDLDPDQPRIKLSLLKRQKTYYGLKTTNNKLDHLIKVFKWAPINKILRF